MVRKYSHSKFNERRTFVVFVVNIYVTCKVSKGKCLKELRQEFTETEYLYYMLYLKLVQY